MTKLSSDSLKNTLRKNIFIKDISNKNISKFTLGIRLIMISKNVFNLKNVFEKKIK